MERYTNAELSIAMDQPHSGCKPNVTLRRPTLNQTFFAHLHQRMPNNEEIVPDLKRNNSSYADYHPFM
ncbi:hypothetical protein TNCV_3571601 [Trichonephila clavipes]|nr:hypothetical protein TNCV_3571601 [Trichonephila clavipes]